MRGPGHTRKRGDERRGRAGSNRKNLEDRTGGKDRMNEALKREHRQRITDQKARRMYDRLCDACEKRVGGMTDPDQMKQMLQEDIAKRGIGEERRNGRQTYWAENKSLAQLRAFCETQRKGMAELKLTPQSRKAETVVVDDDFDSFPD